MSHTVKDAVQHKFRQGSPKEAVATVELSVDWRKAMEIIQAVPTFRATKEDAVALSALADKIRGDIEFEECPKLRVSYDSANEKINVKALETGELVCSMDYNKWRKSDNLAPNTFMGRSMAGWMGSLDYRDTPRARKILSIWETTHLDKIHDEIAKIDGVAPGFV